MNVDGTERLSEHDLRAKCTASGAPWPHRDPRRSRPPCGTRRIESLGPKDIRWQFVLFAAEKTPNSTVEENGLQALARRPLN